MLPNKKYCFEGCYESCFYLFGRRVSGYHLLSQWARDGNIWHYFTACFFSSNYENIYYLELRFHSIFQAVQLRYKSLLLCYCVTLPHFCHLETKHEKLWNQLQKLKSLWWKTSRWLSSFCDENCKQIFENKQTTDVRGLCSVYTDENRGDCFWILT